MMSIRRTQKIGVLTYNVPHRKTYDTLCLLKARGYQNVVVYAADLHYVKKFQPLIEHRPQVNMDLPCPKVLCENFAYEYTEESIENVNVDSETIFLVCGAGILPDDFVQKYRVINSHPGYIPLARGLDALKWSVYEQLPIGVTTHFLGEYVDAGEVIERRVLEVEKYDTFHLLSQKVYENEIDMLVSAIEKVNEQHEFIEPGDSVVHRRMPHEIEEKLFEKFEARKVKD